MGISSIFFTNFDVGFFWDLWEEATKDLKVFKSGERGEGVEEAVGARARERGLPNQKRAWP